MKDQDKLDLSFKVKNIGSTYGSEVAQIYVKDIKSTIFRPDKELKAFKKIYLQPGEEQTVQISLDARAFSFYNININDWYVESGEFELLIGSSSRDIHLNASVEIEATVEAQIMDYQSTAPEYFDLSQQVMSISTSSFEALLGRKVIKNSPIRKGEFNMTSTLQDISITFIGNGLRKMILKNMLKMMGSDNEKQVRMMEAIVNDMPVRSMVLMGGGRFNFGMADGLIDMVNGKLFKGLVKFVKSK